MTEQQVPAEEYVGPAVVSASSTTPDTSSTTLDTSSTALDTSSTTDDAVTVDVTLRGHFEPLDGRFHWYGRLAAHEALGRLRPGTDVVVTTPHGSAAGRLSDLDPWGRFRVSGTGRPPF
jgi:hypothetical protein